MGSSSYWEMVMLRRNKAEWRPSTCMNAEHLNDNQVFMLQKFRMTVQNNNRI